MEPDAKTIYQGENMEAVSEIILNYLMVQFPGTTGDSLRLLAMNLQKSKAEDVKDDVIERCLTPDRVHKRQSNALANEG